MQSTLWKTTPMFRIPLSPSPHFARFHSTPISLSKWKSKWDHKDEGRAQKPSKTHIRYAVRQKRADTKKALKDFLLYGKSSKLYSQDDGLKWCADEISSRNAKVKNNSHDFDNFPRSKSSGNSKPHSSSYSGRRKSSGSKRWQHKQQSYDVDDDGHPGTIFEATFGGQRCYTWSFTSWENCNFNNPTAGFNWRDESRWERTQRRVWSESDVDDESTDIGCHSHRVTLGLPPTGPLNLNDVKCAFRVSALKWHPDKHQGPSQAMAEEKFKLCVDAYNSLCNALKLT